MSAAVRTLIRPDSISLTVLRKLASLTLKRPARPFAARTTPSVSLLKRSMSLPRSATPTVWVLKFGC
ncbi:hypothetical protein D3C80_2147440 [compost metagenome]